MKASINITVNVDDSADAASFLDVLKRIEGALTASAPPPIPSPQIPQPANSSPIACVFGSPGNVGAFTEFARADHAHAMPPDPIPPHAANASTHQNLGVSGDVTGTVRSMVVSSIRGIPVRDAAPVPGMILVFRDKPAPHLAWEKPPRS